MKFNPFKNHLILRLYCNYIISQFPSLFFKPSHICLLILFQIHGIFFFINCCYIHICLEKQSTEHLVVDTSLEKSKTKYFLHFSLKIGLLRQLHTQSVYKHTFSDESMLLGTCLEVAILETTHIKEKAPRQKLKRKYLSLST